jgi:AtzE family amidohydrolase
MTSATEIAAAIRAGKTSAESVARASLERIALHDGALNSFTLVTEKRALQEARQVDSALAAGDDPGPLAGVPFAVKNLFDIAGVPTLAGSRIRAKAPPAAEDAAAVRKLRQAGAVLMGALNMDEFAYGFTTENAHYGPTHNPHDLTRVAGGSSGGSAAAVASGMVPLSLGSDTNGSIRVPAAFCGIFGLKPTYGRVSRAGAFLFAASLDHVGPFARTVEDLALTFDVLQGPDPNDPVCTTRPAEPCHPHLQEGLNGLRIAIAGDYFTRQIEPDALSVVYTIADVLNVKNTVHLPEAARARAAAYVITASEGGNQHLDDLHAQAENFDPATRSRFLAGALTPAAWVSFAQRFRTWYREQMRALFETVDVIIAPATPCSAIRIGQKTITLDGKEMPARPNLGLFTQPISFIGLPVVTVPVHRPGEMPLGVQLIAAPYQEEKLLRVAWHLQAQGAVAAPVAQPIEALI